MFVWQVDKDHLGGTEKGYCCQVHKVKDSDEYVTSVTRYEDTVPVKADSKFRLLDDDGELYYSGRVMDPNYASNMGYQYDTYFGMEILDPEQHLLDFWMNDSGCTRLDIHNGDKWETVIG